MVNRKAEYVGAAYGWRTIDHVIKKTSHLHHNQLLYLKRRFFAIAGAGKTWESFAAFRLQLTCLSWLRPVENSKTSDYKENFTSLNYWKMQLNCNNASRIFTDNEDRLSIIAFLMGICFYPPKNILFTVFSISLPIKRFTNHTQGALPRSKTKGSIFNVQCAAFNRLCQMNSNIAIEFCSLSPALRQHLFLFLAAKARKESGQLAVGNWQEDKKVNIIEVFSGMIYPPFFFMFIVVSGPLHVKKIARYPQGALPRSGLLLALRQHRWGSVKNYKQFVGIVIAFIMKNFLISCLDKAVITSSLYRAVCGPIPINSSTALSGPRPHGFLFFLAAKEREETRREEDQTVRGQTVRRSVALCSTLFTLRPTPSALSFKNRWVSPGGVRKGTGES